MYADVYYDRHSSSIMYVDKSKGGSEYKVEAFVPDFYVPTHREPCAYGIYGQPLERIAPRTYHEFFDLKQNYVDKNISTFEATIDPRTKFIQKTYPDNNVENLKLNLNICYLDIETEQEKEYGFPNPTIPHERVLSISLLIVEDNIEHAYVLGLDREYTGPGKFSYQRCSTEVELFEKLIALLNRHQVDIITGWYIELFDIPYIINRMEVLESGFSKKLSPFGRISKRTRSLKYKKVVSYEIVGRVDLDYLQIYKVFCQRDRENYTLDYVAQYELDEKKVQHSSLKSLYRNNWNKFIEYNFRDVELVRHLDEKLGYISIVVLLAYLCGIPFKSTLTTIAKVDGALLKHIKTNFDEKIRLPDVYDAENFNVYEGAFVMEPQRGIYDWMAVLDVVSLYPSLIMQFNISPETHLLTIKSQHIVDAIFNNNWDLSSLENTEIKVEAARTGATYTTEALPLLQKIKENSNYILLSNGAVFERDTDTNIGIVPSMLKSFFDLRRQIKAKATIARSKEGPDSPEYIRNDKLQYALKIFINSVYGALGSSYFRLYDRDGAEAVTTTGKFFLQHSIQSINTFYTQKWPNVARKHTQTDVTISPKEKIVKYADTDGVCIHIGALLKSLVGDITLSTQAQFNYVSKLVPLIESVINTSVKTCLFNQFGINQDDCHIKFEYDILAKRMLLIQKKRYVFIEVDKNTGKEFGDIKHSLRAKGVEIVRSSTPHIIRDVLRQIFYKLLETQDSNVINDMLLEVYKNFMAMSIDEIAFPRTVSNINKFLRKSDKIYGWRKGTPIHVKAAIAYNKLLSYFRLDTKYEKLYDGDKMKFVYLTPNNPFRISVLGFKDNFPSEFGLDAYVDYKTMFDKIIISPLEHVYSILHWGAVPRFDEVRLDNLF